MAEGRHRLVDFDQQYRKSEEKIPMKEKVTQVIKERWSKISCKAILKGNFPFLENLRGYKILKDFPNDVISGITVGIMNIPQAMAYAALATLPPICGLYASLFAPIPYFFLGTSRYASMGLIAVVSLMVGSVLDVRLGSAEVDGLDPNVTINDTMGLNINDTLGLNFTLDLDPAQDMGGISPADRRRIEVATALSFVSGLFMMAFGKLGLGFVTTLMPNPLIGGFTTGVAVHVTTSQIKNVLGIKIPRYSGVFKIIKTWIVVFSKVTDVNVATLVTSLIAMIIMYIVKVCVNLRFQHRLKIPIPIELLVVILATGLSYGVHFNSDFGVSIVGTIPAGIPMPKLPDVTLVKDHISDAIIIGVIAFAQSVSMAKTLAIKHGQLVNSNQEMFAYGACSVTNSFFSGYISAFSLSRSLVQEGAGCTSQVASLVMCSVVLVVVLAIGPLFYHLPKCILSSIILINMRGMFRQVLQLPPLWRHAKYDLVIWLVTFFATVVLDADLGLATGIAFSLLSLVIRSQRAMLFSVGEVANTGEFRPIEKYKQVKSTDEVMVIEVSSPIFFANSEMFSQKIFKTVGLDAVKSMPRRQKKELDVNETKTNGQDISMEDRQKGADGEAEEAMLGGGMGVPQRVVLNMAGVLFLDTMGVIALQSVMRELTSRGIKLTLVAVRDDVMETLRAAEFPDELMEMMYLSLASPSGDVKARSSTEHLDTSPL